MFKKVVISIVIAAFAVLAAIIFYAHQLLGTAKDYKAVFSLEAQSAALTETQTDDKEVIPVKPADNDKPDYLEKINGTSMSAINLLFLGIDKTAERDKWLRIYRSDTIVLATIDLETRKVKLLSIPRDTYAYIKCIKKFDKINHAYAFGGMDEAGIRSSEEAVKKLTGCKEIPYYFTLDMEPVPEIVDTLGGVSLDVDTKMSEAGVSLEKGYQELDGRKAFLYIHWRFSGNGDIDRIKRQQKFAGAMLKKLKSEAGVMVSIKAILKYRNNIKTNMSNVQMLALAQLLQSIPEEEISCYSVPGEGKYMRGISYWIPDREKLQKLLEEHFAFK